MAEPMPKWLTRRYAILWKELKDRKFSFSDAREKLNETDDKRLSVILSDFKKYGWIEVELDPQSSRKRLYKLKSPDKAIEEIAKKSI